MTEAEDHKNQIKAEAKAEAKETLRKPARTLRYGVLVLVVSLIGFGIVLNNFSDTIYHIDRTANHIDRTASNTDAVVRNVTGPEAQARQAEGQKQVVNLLLQGMDCTNQRNLQRAITVLKDNGVIVTKAELQIVEPKCQLPQGASP